MEKKASRSQTTRPSAGTGPREYHALSQRILQSANSDISHADFLREITGMLLDFSECNAVELCVERGHQSFRCEAFRDRAESADVEFQWCLRRDDDGPLAHATENDRAKEQHEPRKSTEFPSLIAIPLIVAEETIGLLQFKARDKDFFRAADTGYYENVAQTLGLALISQRMRASLRERVKELTCLYHMAQLMERPAIRLEEVLQSIAALLPPAWQYPEAAAARIVLDGECFSTEGFSECVSRQTAPLAIKDQTRGCIEVGYSEEKPEFDEGPFLEEERNLLDIVARQVSSLVERRQAAEDRKRLQVQLRHADRLATIGQLSAGVAHELNEPLGNILAFAQLARKEPDLPQQTARDLDKIVTTSLHAREIIKKLMLFARQMPPRKSRVSLNALVEEGLYFLESRCMKDGVAIQRHLSPRLPDIVADPSQLNQVLVNLVVNAIQAMPGGGVLKISTHELDDWVAFCVEDNGVGMPSRVLKRIFVPFFTTKDIHEGTGLGLPVVHGIVTSHGGTIEVESVPGRGSKFEVRLPLANAEEET